jgi:hypothetical protein
VSIGEVFTCVNVWISDYPPGMRFESDSVDKRDSEFWVPTRGVDEAGLGEQAGSCGLIEN